MPITNAGASVLILGPAALGILAGWSLLNRQTWARMLHAVVLLPAKSEEEYRQIAKAAQH